MFTILRDDDHVRIVQFQFECGRIGYSYAHKKVIVWRDPLKMEPVKIST